MISLRVSISVFLGQDKPSIFNPSEERVHRPRLHWQTDDLYDNINSLEKDVSTDYNNIIIFQ